MTTLVPVPRPAADRQLATWAGCRLSFSRLLPGATDDPIDSRLAAFVEHCITPGTAWVGRVRGRRDEVEYVLDVVGVTRRTLRRDPGRMRGLRRVELVVNGRAELLTLLDAAATAQCELVVVQVDSAAIEPACAALAADDDAATAALARVLVLRERGTAGAVVAHAGEAVESAAVRPGTHAAMAVLPRLAVPRRRRRVTALAAAVPLVIIATVGVTLSWRHAGSTPPVAAPSVGGQAASGSAFLGLPLVRFGAGVAYDQARHQVVLFGGVGSDDQTWVWNGHWNQARAAVSPPGRFGAAMAYDPQTGLVMMYGGRATRGAPLGDTWTWDGQTWTQIPTPSAPPQQELPAMAYDAARHTTVLVSGCCGDGDGPPQTWTWDSGAWVQKHPVTTAPRELTSAIAYDPRTHSVLLVGGAQQTGGGASTWSWDGAEWRELHPAHAPPVGVAMTLVADPQTGELLLLSTVAAQNGGPALRTVRWDGADWTESHPATVPTNLVAAAGDSDRGIVVAFGRDDTRTDGALTTEWAWTGMTWAVLSAPATADRSTLRPPARFETAMAFDPVHGELVVFGGGAVSTSSQVDLGDTWTWDGTRWTQRAPPSSPSPRQGAVLAFDPPSKTVLLFGGYMSTTSGLPPLEETWSWDGTTWTQLHPSSSPPPGSTVDGMAYDELTRTMVLVTSCCDVAPGIGPGAPRRVDTWSWDGTRWVQQHPTTSPPSPGPAAMSYDPAHGILVAVVAGTAVDGIGSTWSFDGHDWQQLDAGRATIIDWLTASLSADPASGRLLLVQRTVDFTLVGGGAVVTWDGTNWKATFPGDGFHVDTSRHATRPFYDATLGRLVIIGGPFDDFSETWMFTGITWVALDQVGQGAPVTQSGGVGVGGAPHQVGR